MVVLETHGLRSDKPDLWDVMDGRDHLVVASLVFFGRPRDLLKLRRVHGVVLKG